MNDGTVPRQQCNRIEAHPAHKWMLGRKAYQCQGAASPTPADSADLDAIERLIASDLPNMVMSRVPALIAELRSTRTAAHSQRVLLERAWAHANSTGAERLRDDIAAALARTAAPGPDADITWSTSLGEPRGACCHCEHVAPGQVVVDVEHLRNHLALSKQDIPYDAPAVVRERWREAEKHLRAALSPDPSPNTEENL